MKKALVLVLAVALVMSMAVSTAAVGSPVAPGADTKTTSPLPKVVTDDLDGNLIIELIPTEDAEDLTEEEQKIFEDAQKSLEDATPSGMNAQYFFYFRAFYAGEGEKGAKVTEPLTVSFEIDDVSKVVVKQFVDGAWVERETTINGDGTVTVEGLVEGPTAIFTKPLPKAEVEGAEAGDIIIELVPPEEEDKLSEEEQQALAVAAETLEEATPAGMNVESFSYFRAFHAGDLTRVTGPLDIKLDMSEVSQVVVKQFIDGAWIERDAVVHANGTITIDELVEGPIAIFTE